MDKVAIAQNIPPAPTPTPIVEELPTPTPTAMPVEEPTEVLTEAPPKETPTPQLAQTPIIELYFFFKPSGCPYSRSQAQDIERFYKEYGTATFIQPNKSPGLAAPFIQGSRLKVKVVGIPKWWSEDDINSFRSRTGSTFPMRPDNGEIARIGVSKWPTIGLHNTKTDVWRKATSGEVSYQAIVSHVNDFAEGKSRTTSTGGG
jgi:hypothetical protein